jgi:hypothetical protein
MAIKQSPAAPEHQAAQKMASYLPLRTVRQRLAVPAAQAAENAPSLAALAALAQQSAHCLRLVTPLIPETMRSGVQAGPLVAAPIGQAWCLLAANSAVAAKLRQLVPALAAHLRTKGLNVHEIRIKMAMRHER